MITVELYGVPRLRAGTGRVPLEGPLPTLGEALEALALACPALDGTVIDGERLHAAYRLSLNGDRFVAEPDTPLTDGDTLLLLAADVGG